MLISKSYESITRGVSEQVPHERKPGQNTAQLNMISDPVRGIARRHGSIAQDEKSFADYTSEAYAATLEDVRQFRTFSFFIDGNEYVLIARTKTKPALSAAPVCWCFNKETGEFINVQLATSDSVLDSLAAGGVSAFANTGRFIFIAGHDIVPTLVETDVHGATANRQRMAVWVRGGAYSRTFTVTLKMADTSTKVLTYKTKASSYPGVLDTSDILTADPDYQKKVNDRTSDYNTASTQWIGEAAEDIQPDNIAQKLLDEAVVQGLTGQRIGSHILFDYDQNILEVSVDDGGDGTLLRGVGSEVSAADLVSTVHYVGKVVKVRPKSNNGSDAFYLKAYPKIDGSTGWAEVVWRECAGYEMRPSGVFVYGSIEGGTLYLAGSATGLQAMTLVENPEFQANAVGDKTSAPPPKFIGKKITYMGMMQDRLVVVSNAVVFMSRPGDYLNFFQQSVLTVADDDPIEMFARGSEDDIITAGAIYDKSLFLFGKLKQYAVPGKSTLTPKSHGISAVGAFEDGTDAYPASSGNFMFYAKPRNRQARIPSSSLYQLQLGIVADSPESYDLSQQLDKFLLGLPVEIVAVTVKPPTIFFRTTGEDNALYLYRYIDNAGNTERLWDSWQKWQWHAEVGTCCGITDHDGDLLAFTVRHGEDPDTNLRMWVACDRFSLDTSLSDYPYADSLRSLEGFHTPVADAWLHIDNPGTLTDVIAAFSADAPEFLIGTTGERMAEFLAAYGVERRADMLVGMPYDAYVVPTNPVLKSYNNNPILDGRLTVGSMLVALTDSCGCEVQITAHGKTVTAYKGEGRRTGHSSLGEQPVVSEKIKAGVGRETGAYTMKVKANRWLPLTISAMSYRGQYFSNARRI